MQDGREGHGSSTLRRAAATDNPGSRAGAGAGPEARVEAADSRLARLLAREHFARPSEAANDNAQTGEAGER